jgi:hypothetical protein
MELDALGPLWLVMRWKLCDTLLAVMTWPGAVC